MSAQFGLTADALLEAIKTNLATLQHVKKLVNEDQPFNEAAELLAKLGLPAPGKLVNRTFFFKAEEGFIFFSSIQGITVSNEGTVSIQLYPSASKTNSYTQLVLTSDEEWVLSEESPDTTSANRLIAGKLTVL
jgi:hypothetical protein